MYLRHSRIVQSWLLVVAIGLAFSQFRLRAADSSVAVEKDGKAIRVGIVGEDGKEYSLEAIEALLNEGKTWRSIATVAPSTRPAFVYDPTCTAKPQSFYRLRQVQGATPVQISDFRLLDMEGRALELYYQSDQKAVVLVFCGGDLSCLAPEAPELKAARDAFSNQNVVFWLINSRTNLNRAEVLTKATALGLDFTILEDEGGAVTRQLSTGTAPEAVVVDPTIWSVAYRGRIANLVETASATNSHAPLAEALQELVGGNRVTVKQTEVIGAPISLASYADRTYSEQIAPLLLAKCARCHNPGNIAPWWMTNYATIQQYAPQIKDSILTRRMPPWHADPHVQSFANSEMLSPDQLATVVDWIDRGAPRGDGVDPLPTSIPPPPPDWPIGTPDKIITIAQQNLPAHGTIDYRYVVVANPYPSDVWLQATVVKPGNRKVVHHVLVFSASSIADLLQIKAGLGGYFAAYVPGQEPVPFPDGTGKLLKAGSFLVFQLHYTASGEPETDLTELGLYLRSTPPGSELKTAAAYNLDFTIPPGTNDQPATAEFVLPNDVILHEMSPHMHFRGTHFRFDAIYPDGKTETLVNVPFYRFAWQSLYRLSTPKQLPAGTRIVCSGGWDNSTKNIFNPDSTATVAFGEQSWEEMFIGYFNYSDPR